MIFMLSLKLGHKNMLTNNQDGSAPPWNYECALSQNSVKKGAMWKS